VAEGKGGMRMEELFDLKGKVAFVTGATGLLGTKHCETLAAAGANVAVTDLDETRCIEAAEKLSAAHGVDCAGIGCDVSDKDSVAQAFGRLKERYGRLDVLLNNAAGKSENFFAPFEDFPLEDWDRVLRVNLTGMFLCAQEAGKLMLERGGGSMINVASIYGVVAPDQGVYGDSGINAPAVYSASKGGVVMLTKYLAAYWGDKGIRVNSITPGGVFDGQDPEFVKNYSRRTPMGRMADREDFRGAILYLASDASAYVTGHNLVVDGGWTAW